MRRLSVIFSLFAIALVWVGLGPGGVTVAQDATPAALAAHPLVGTWFVDGLPDDPTNPPDMAVFAADGTMVDISRGQSAGGVWEATGPRTAAVTFVFVDDTEDFAGTFTIRSVLEVDAAGETFTDSYSFTLVAADGTVLDSGTGAVQATRLAVEPVEAAGTPVGGVPTWAPASDEGGPEASSSPAP